jgi:hypothetical protein
MNEPEKNSQRDHWQAIADQLGLSSEPEASERPREEPLARTPAAPAPMEKTFSRREDPKPQSPDRKLDPESRAESPVLRDEDLSSEDSDSAKDSDRPRRGRRRRGEKSGPATEEGEGRAPRRGRGRKPQPEEESAPTDDELPSEEQPPSQSPDDDDDEIPRMSEWNVPSWNDLISSLYRPDR